ncbi:hypothetical protein DFJ74DRAFT_713882 [Hyaloraphidium curvatum]|nr:hypothetical protein DFJ74DRAFT_713882 [Hyaloraphidium curvatum]
MASQWNKFDADAVITVATSRAEYARTVLEGFLEEGRAAGAGADYANLREWQKRASVAVNGVAVIALKLTGAFKIAPWSGNVVTAPMTAFTREEVQLFFSGLSALALAPYDPAYMAAWHFNYPTLSFDKATMTFETHRSRDLSAAERFTLRHSSPGADGLTGIIGLATFCQPLADRTADDVELLESLVRFMLTSSTTILELAGPSTDDFMMKRVIAEFRGQVSDLQVLRGDDKCDWCEAPGKKGAPLKRCGRCKVARYCSSYCQKAAWAVHKKNCSGGPQTS